MDKRYGYNRQTRHYTGPCPVPAALLDPVNQSAAPADTLPFAPPIPDGHQVVLVNTTFDDWELVADYTGTVYSKADGQPVEHIELGELPTDLTRLAPATPYDEWNDATQSWVTHTAKQLEGTKAAKLQDVNAWADRQLTPLRYLYPEGERDSWPIQRYEAKMWEADNTTPTPYIDALIMDSGETREALLAKILENIRQYDGLTTPVNRQARTLRQAIKAAATVEEVEAIVVPD
ncbi:hypothetical protein GCM10023116_39530 [Kistimonas scapharcae]|uniref:Tail fiber assembly protein n=1 Tax=Kistimonas scapharcae TaxID=1036133 RepID=A0ABP8V6Q9_9GAMM